MRYSYYIVVVEGGIEIRTLRSRKFRKKHRGLMIVIQLAAIWYVAILSLSYLTSQTGAYFNDRHTITGVIQAGIWEETGGEWDKSSIEFFKKSPAGVCGSPLIAAIRNHSNNDMAGTTQYEVYHAAAGNPKKGEKVGEGEVPVIKSNETFNLSYEASKSGNYMFKVYQRPGHPGNGELWSEEIKLVCKDAKSEPDVTPPTDEQTKKQEKAKPEEQKVEPIIPPAEPPEEQKEQADVEPMQEKEQEVPPENPEPPKDMGEQDGLKTEKPGNGTRTDLGQGDN